MRPQRRALALLPRQEESSIFRRSRTKRRARPRLATDFYSRPYVEATFTARASCCSMATENRRRAFERSLREPLSSVLLTRAFAKLVSFSSLSFRRRGVYAAKVDAAVFDAPTTTTTTPRREEK